MEGGRRRSRAPRAGEPFESRASSAWRQHAQARSILAEIGLAQEPPEKVRA